MQAALLSSTDVAGRGEVLTPPFVGCCCAASVGLILDVTRLLDTLLNVYAAALIAPTTGQIQPVCELVSKS